MSIIDKVVAAVAPPSEKSRQEARARARAAAEPNDWLSTVLQHHLQIESAFEAVKMAPTPAARLAAQKELMVIFTGHSNAEDAVLYPALAHFGEKGSAATGYTEQAGAQTNLGALEYMDPMSQDYLDKLEHLRSAVARHVYEEEGTRYPELKEKMPATDQARLTQRFREEFDRYMRGDTHWTGSIEAVTSRRAVPPADPGSTPSYS